MVKTRTLFPLGLLVVCAVTMSGCPVRGPFVNVTTEALELSRAPAAPFLSLAHSPGALFAVFADRAAATLDLVELPDGPHLPSASPFPEIIDKVDVAAPLSPAFGEHVLSVAGGSSAVFYLDRETDVKNVLKLATRKIGEREWNLDILEPAGDPLALDSDERGGFSAAWSTGLLSYRTPDGQTASVAPPIPFQIRGRASPDGAGGFTAFDSLTSQLLWLRWTGTGYSILAIPGGSPVQASLRSASGLLRVLSWDATARRLMLRQEREPGGTFSSATVTVCDGTGTVALLPGQSDTTFMMLFDEIRSLGAGRFVSQLSLIAPGSLLGARGTRYRKAVLSSGDARIDGFAATRTVDALYVLLSQGDLRLLRIPLGPSSDGSPKAS
jgi:hypothetical protein